MPAALPLTDQAVVERSGSPSASTKPVWLQLRVSPAWALAGLMATAAMEGGVLPTETLALRGLPVSVPSSGVAVQTTASPVVKALAERLAPVPAAVPLTVQARVDWSVSPSGSEKPV